MSSCRRYLALCTALLAVSLGSLALASAEEQQGKAKATPAEAVPVEAAAAGNRKAEEAASRVEEAGIQKPEEPEVVETELTPEELWMLVRPWGDEEVEVHGTGSRGGESQIRTHSGTSSERGITTHTQSSGAQERIPVTRIGESNDADIVVHGGSREGPSRIRVHGPTGD